MAGALHTYEILIIERHLDTFGHVNNATYLDLFEAARWDWITANGYGLERIRELRQGPTILDLRLQFKREIVNRQRIKISSWVESYEGKIGTVVQQMHNETGTLCCNAEFVIGLFDLEKRRLIPPTPEWRRAVGLEPDAS